MTATENPMGLSMLVEGSGSFDERAADAECEPSVTAPDALSRDLRAMAIRIAELHPDIPLTTATALVERAHAELEDARVQSFRMILTERAVRGQLVGERRRR